MKVCALAQAVEAAPLSRRSLREPLKNTVKFGMGFFGKRTNTFPTATKALPPNHRPLQ